MDKVAISLSPHQHIIPIVYSPGKELLSRITATQQIDEELQNILAKIVNIVEDEETLCEAENEIIALLGSIYDQCNEEKYGMREDLFKFCCNCINDLAYLRTLPDYTNAQELAFSIAAFHNRNILSSDINKLYSKLIQTHTELMMDTVLYFIEMRHKNTVLHVDNELLSTVLKNLDYDLLPWFRKRSAWSKFHFLFYGKCFKRDTKFYDPENYMQPIVRALSKKDSGHSATEMLRISLRGLDYDEFMRNYFHKFMDHYRVCTSDDIISTTYNYNLLHYVLPTIIDAYQSKVVSIVAALTDRQPFFEDLFLAALAIANRKRLLNLDWCLNDNIHYNLQVCQPWVAERTLHAMISEISESNNIIICFTLLRRFMNTATYDRLCSVHILDVLRKFMMHLKSFASKLALHNKSLKDVADFVTFLIEFTKARFREAENNQKQYYYEIFMQTRQNLPDFFRKVSTKTSTKPKTCAALSAKHFLHLLKHGKICGAEEIDCYLQILLRHKQLHLVEHTVTLLITTYSHRPTNILPAIFTVYRKLVEANILAVRCVKAETIERIILGIIPKQIDTDPNIFVNMDAVLEETVIEGVQIISHLTNNNVEESSYNTVDYLRLCEHILDYGPSKKLVFEISRLHRAALKQEATKSTHCFVNYVMGYMSLITGSNVLIARRSMRRHPSITETVRNILIATVAYEARTSEILHRRLQDELLRSVKNPADMYFVLATEAQRVVFDTKEFPFKNVILLEQLIMHILNSLDFVMKWEAITALIQLLQAILSTLLSRDDPLLYRGYFGLVVKVTSMVPSRAMTAIAALHVLHVLGFKDHSNALQFTPTAQNYSMFSKVLYECTISSQNHPDEAVVNLAIDINAQSSLEKYSDETCRAVVALTDNLCS